MQSTTSRRGLLKAAPIAAVAIALPDAVLAAGGIDPEWERLKAEYRVSVERFDRASAADCRRDDEEHDFNKTAPERECTFTEEGLTIENGDVRIELKERPGAFVLTRNNYKRCGPLVEKAPGYADYCAELRAWEARREAFGAERGWPGVEREWEAACDAQDAAWRALVAYPVTDARLLAEKVELATAVDMMSCDGDPAELVEAIQADLARIAHA